MIKKLLFLLATVGLVANITGCTSKKAQDETEIVENADVDKIDAESGTPPADAAAPATDDASLQAALGETSTPPADASTAAQLDAPPTETPALDNTATASTESVQTSPDIAAAPTLDETSLNDIPAPTDPSVMASTETPAVTETPVVEENPAPVVEASKDAAAPTETPATSFTSEPSPLSDSSSTTTAAVTESAPAPKPAGSSLKKIALTTPYQTAGGWVNTVYVARPGEKLKTISQMIFGADKSKELKKIQENAYLKSRAVRPGDKIYYVSPHRPDDSTKMLVYYEDAGIMPETYVAQKGDRLKKVSKKLLGYDKAWVEMWTSNGVESKDKLNEGETLRYWKTAATVTPDVSTTTIAKDDHAAPSLVDQSQMPTPPPTAGATTPPPQQVAQNTAPPTDMNSLPPPPPPDAPVPPPPAPDMNAAAPPPPPPPDMNTPPPPPADMNAAPPPPPPGGDQAAAPAPGGKKKFSPGAEEEAPAGGLDQDTLMSLGAVGVLTVAMAFVLISRRRKKRAAEAAMTEHNVGT